MRLAALPLGLALLLGSTAPALGQGQDTCANAQVIVGTGTFAFDSSTATTDGTPDPLCYAFGSSDIDNDVWFSWTAPADGYHRLNTCTQTTVDTKLGVYDGGCAGPVLACNDDTCGLQSEVVWPVVAGSTYVLRIGSFPGAPGGTGTFLLEPLLPTTNPVNGHHYLAVPQPGITWDDASLTAQSLTYQGAAGYLATLTDQTENDFVFALSDVHYHWLGGYQDLDDPGYFEPDGAWKWITGEPWVYTNWLAGEPNNAGAFGSEDYLELLQGGQFGETWNDVHPLEHSRGFVVEWNGGAALPYCFGDGSGLACPCGNTGGTGQGCANSSGAGGVLAGSGSASVSADDLVFTATNLLPAQPALLFAGLNAINGGNGLPFGDGLRCAGGSVVRLGTQAPDGSGSASWGPGLGAQGGWGAGDQRRFQAWYRDPASSPCGTGFNLSHGLEVVFSP